MARSRLRLKALGLFTLMLGLMALTASAAQAEKGAAWGYINKSSELKLFGAGLEPTIGIEVEELKDEKDPGKHMVLLTEILKKKVAILCKEMTTDIKLKAEGQLLGLLTFHQCIIKVGGVTLAACEPHSGASKGIIKSLELVGLIRLHVLTEKETDKTVEIFPDEGSNALAHIETGPECSIGEELLIGGVFSVQDCQHFFSTHLVTHLVEEFPALTKLWVVSNTAEHKATIDGSANVFLVGAHAGLLWAGLAA